MALHRLKKIVKEKRRLGRGISKGGAKSGKGMKGQKSRAGYSGRAGFEGGQTPLYQRLPKARGSKQIFPSQVVKPFTLSTSRLDGLAEGDIVGLGVLNKAGLLSRHDRTVKLVAGSEVKNKMTVRVHAATKAAIEAVEKAGGKVELIPTK